MNKPNTFIIGAPKCGTTSLSVWINQHPDVFMSDPKEPHFFNTDSSHHHCIDIEHYESLFQEAETESIIAEASVWYLVSEVAVKNIVQYSPGAKFVVCLRNPIEASVSLHDQKVFSGGENLSSFMDARNIQEDRKSGTVKLPPTCTDYRQLMYGESCLFGSLVEKVTEVVDKDNVHLIFLDDLHLDPLSEMRRLERFLGIDEYGFYKFAVVNTSKKRKSKVLAQFHRLVSMTKRKLKITYKAGVMASLNKWNQIERKRDEIDESTLDILRNYFEPDIRLIEKLADRDLSKWLE